MAIVEGSLEDMVRVLIVSSLLLAYSSLYRSVGKA